ncbi:hypothetical protein QBC35DRAFT_508902 [Podospora australis]|uniref:Uncharacterized protein n=1 Tax=Podospora australis TaxID=1536484 RepID=A0AAN6WJM7_9PEZI|nr:hypothetical protein QBC35DRAFT_508902 [Podospora australis]
MVSDLSYPPEFISLLQHQADTAAASTMGDKTPPSTSCSSPSLAATITDVNTEAYLESLILNTPWSGGYSGIKLAPKAIPTPGKIYIITDSLYKRIMTLVEGKLLASIPKQASADRGSWYWRCVERDGWLGFRNMASGTYLGQDGRKGVQASAPHHKAWEQFCVRPHPRGGYCLLSEHWDKLMKVTYSASAENGSWSLASTELEVDGSVWEFVEVLQDKI